MSEWKIQHPTPRYRHRTFAEGKKERMATRTVHDPFLGKAVQVSDRLKDRLRGRYAVGPTMPNGEPEFGWRQHHTPPVQHEAADRIEALEVDGREVTRLLDLWSEIPGAEDFAPYQDTMAFLGKPNSVGWVWAREVREERDFDKEQARQRDLAMQCVCEAEEREQAAHARIEALEQRLQKIAALDPKGIRADDLGRAARIARGDE